MRTAVHASVSIQPGVFLEPADAQPISIPDEPEAMRNCLSKVWQDEGPFWAYPKPDGWRCQIHKIGQIVRLFSREGIDWATTFSVTAQAIGHQVTDERAILDSELVFFDREGLHLEPHDYKSAYRVHCTILDALFLGGRQITTLPAFERIPLVWKSMQ